MTEYDLEVWFLDIFKSCQSILLQGEPIVYWLYDKSHIRKCKLSRLNGKFEEIEFIINLSSSLCLFEYDIKNNHFWVSDSVIWCKLLEFFNNENNEVFKFINNIFKSIYLRGFEYIGYFDSTNYLLDNNSIFFNRLLVYDYTFSSFNDYEVNNVFNVLKSK